MRMMFGLSLTAAVDVTDAAFENVTATAAAVTAAALEKHRIALITVTPQKQKQR